MTMLLRNTMGGANTDTAGTGLYFATNAAAYVGDLVIVAIAKDNSSATDGKDVTNEVTAVVDSRNNGWKKLGEYSKGGGGAAAGSVLALYMSVLGRAMPIGTTIQTTTDLCSGKAMGAIAFSLAACNEAYNPIAIASNAVAGGALTSLGSGLLSGSVETLFFRAAAIELGPGTRGSPTPSASWAAGMDYYGTTMWLWAEYSIQTTTAAASAPTTVGATADSGSLHASFRERIVPSILFTGAPL